MKVVVYDFGKATGNSVGTAEILHGCRHDPVKSAEVGQQATPLRRPYARNILQPRPAARSCPLGSMAGNGEAMRLIADFLDQMETDVIDRQL